MRKLLFLHKQTLIKMAKLQEEAPEAETFNILDPFTDEEKVFIKDAMHMMSKSE
ncbi:MULTISPECIES: hypothetical protein [Paenibacillus]|nr:hypothetical protein [Paenibacillus sp. IHBB 10380]